MTTTKPFRLAPRFSERIWGRPNLRPWYESTGTDALVGEAWLTGPECVIVTGAHTSRTLAEVSPEFPLLVKMLFPNEKLSVQVHPDDAQAQAIGQARGKTECWYVLEAEPGATVMLGLKPGVDSTAVRTAVANGTMEQLMEHVPVSVGDMVFVDAGTVHAIGPGVVLLETQQTCDVTYRLYDYGRPRELHLEQGLGVMKTATKAGKVAPRAMVDEATRVNFTRLIEETYFTVDRFELAGVGMPVAINGLGCIVGLRGEGTIDGVAVKAGEAVVTVTGGEAVTVESARDFSFARCVAVVAPLALGG